MQSIDLELDDVFDRDRRYESDEDVGHYEENSNKVPETENDDITANLTKLTKEAAKKRVLRPQPKLDVERLKSSRGLAAIPKIFEKINFKGHGHEAQDLELLMSSLERWGHRLMPSMPFSELTERLEKLGAKKEVQTVLKRIRLDLPFFTGDVQEENEDPPIFGEDIFSQTQVAMDDSVSAINDSIDMHDSSFLFNNSVNNDSITFPSTPGNTSTPSVAMSSSSTLTQEQKERMEKNRQLALQKRLQRSLLATPT